MATLIEGNSKSTSTPSTRARHWIWRKTVRNSARRRISIRELWCEQYGQPWRPLWRLAFGEVRHEWPKRHDHQTFLPLSGWKFVGANPPFFVVSHSAARIGSTSARLFPCPTVLFRQYVHPTPDRNLRRESPFTVRCHTWFGFLGHCHHTALCELCVTSTGVSGWFLVGCQAAARIGSSVAKL